MRRTLSILSFVVAASSVACEASNDPRDTPDGGEHDGASDPRPEASTPPPDAPVTSAPCTTPADCASPESDPPYCVVTDCTDHRCTYHTWDADGDGYFAQSNCRVLQHSVVLQPGDDCADDDPKVHPDAWDGPAGKGPDGKEKPDACNKKDDNCDGLGDNQKTDTASCGCADQDIQLCWAGRDGAPIPYPSNQLTGTCHKGRQFCQNGRWSPCYDAIAPQTEVCDGQDNDCNGSIDDDAIDALPYYCDHDKDDHLAAGTKSEVTCPTNLTDCEGGQWLAFQSSRNRFDDCDDTNPARWTGNPEICDGVDNDCDEDQLVDQRRNDDGGVVDLKLTYYRDRDGDGFGDDQSMKSVCPQQLDGYVDKPGDCNDSVETVRPFAPEVCNGVDDDCDGKTDAEDPKLSGKPPAPPGTDLACENGVWVVTHCPGTALDCDHDAFNACEKDGTSLSDCHDCNTHCSFACGATGCDDIKSISAGGLHTCALTQAGVAACWGSNEYGQLGDENVSAVRFDPVRVGGLPPVVRSIQAGWFHTCAIGAPDGALYCWGDNHTHQLGVLAAIDNTSVPSPKHVDNIPDPNQATLIDVSSVALGRTHTCAIYHSSHVACWGGNTFSQVLDDSILGVEQVSAIPLVRPTPDGDFVEIDDAAGVIAGGYHTCIVNLSHTVECWGRNADGQAGADSAKEPITYPQVVAGLANVSQIAAGDAFTCALSSGDVYCWGNNDSGQLGTAGLSSWEPKKVPGLPRIRAIVAGAAHACAVSDEAQSQLICWGANSAGQTGAATTSGSSRPTVVALSSVSGSTAGIVHTCATSAEHQAYCWGSNNSGQLGIGRLGAGQSSKPLPIDGWK